MTIEMTQLNENASIAWKSPAAGLWVASTRDEYLGMVERRDGRYVASNAFGNDLGTFDELAEAQISIDLDDITPLPDRGEILMMKATMAMAGVAGLGLIAGLFLIAQ